MSGIIVEHLYKTFGGVRAVQDLTFTAEPGTITGFLGPNGAGKTTTLRMLLGLVRADSGRALIGGRRYVDLERPVTEVGAVLEATSFHPDRTARNHLKAVCMATGLPRRRVEESLELVELTPAADRAVGGFSLGMRQRLALATAMLGNPRVLIVDEPANGLDPAGVHWLRGFLRHLADAGATVLVSSHVLSEVERTVDHVLILAGGRLLRDAPLAELTSDHALRIRTAHPAKITDALERVGARVRHAEDGYLLVADVTAEEAAAAAYGAGITLTELTEHKSGLEDIFLELTAGGQGGQPGERP